MELFQLDCNDIRLLFNNYFGIVVLRSFQWYCQIKIVRFGSNFNIKIPAKMAEIQNYSLTWTTVWKHWITPCSIKVESLDLKIWSSSGTHSNKPSARICETGWHPRSTENFNSVKFRPLDFFYKIFYWVATIWNLGCHPVS